MLQHEIECSKRHCVEAAQVSCLQQVLIRLRILSGQKIEAQDQVLQMCLAVDSGALINSSPVRALFYLEKAEDHRPDELEYYSGGGKPKGICVYMDPLSLAFGVAGVLGLLGQTLATTKRFVHLLRHGKEAAAELQNELTILHFNVSRLDRMLKDSAHGTLHFEATSVLLSSTFTFKDRLDALCNELRAASTSRFASLKWPLNSKEHRETIQDLRAYAQCVQFSLSNDGFALLSKTATEVQDVLSKQLEAFRILEAINHRTSWAEHSLSEQTQAVNDQLSAEKRKSVLNWISTVKHEQKHHDIRTPRIEATGQWFLDQGHFKRWRDEPYPQSTVLLCEGIQGSGKSVLTSLVIDHLMDNHASQTIAVAHVYCDYRESEDQSAEKLIASLLKQLAIARPNLPQAVKDFHLDFEKQMRQPQQQDFERAFLLTCNDFDRVYVVIDALDECAASHRRKLLGFLSTARRQPSIRIFITSRSYPEHIIKQFHPAQKLVIEADESDLRKYIIQAVEDSDNSEAIDNEFQQVIVERVCAAAKNMFLLAVLQINAVLNGVSAGEMEAALETMPCGLDGAIEETLHRTQQQQSSRKNLSVKALMWISYAKRPLRVDQLADALAINSTDRTWNPRNRPDSRLILESCLGLVTLDQESSVIRLVHYSVQEYFIRHRKQLFPAAEEMIAENCLTSLLHDAFDTGSCVDESAILSCVSNFPFYLYSCRYWGHHVREVDSTRIDQLAMIFLEARPHLARSYQLSQWDLGRKRVYWELDEANSCTGLHLACVFGLEQLAKKLLEKASLPIDVTTTMGTTPLIKAAAGGHRSCVRMLMERGADPLKENWYGISLHCAAEAGHVPAIEELLCNGVPVDIKDAHGRTALHCATSTGHIGAVNALLSQAADVNATFSDRTPLLLAICLEQRIELIKTLLEYHADIEFETEHGDRAVHEAATMGAEQTLLLLLKHGAKVDMKDASGFTALHWAAAKDHASIVRLLIEHGATIDAKSNEAATPLLCAAEEESVDSVKVLLHAGADVEAGDDDDYTPLHAAISRHDTGIVRMLLEAGANTERKNKAGDTAIVLAHREGKDVKIIDLVQAAGKLARFGRKRRHLEGLFKAQVSLFN
ncbi:MAG: hypothetical protein Q9191_002441 [Dirinaria sp. TL-2023a]